MGFKFYNDLKKYKSFMFHSAPNKEEYTACNERLVFDEANKDFFFPFTYKLTDNVKSDLSYEEARLLFYTAIRFDLGGEDCEVFEDDKCTTINSFEWDYQGVPFLYNISTRDYGDRLSFSVVLMRHNDSYVLIEDTWNDINPLDMRSTFESLFRKLKEVTLLMRNYIAFEGDDDD